jgi:ribosomal protein L21E
LAGTADGIYLSSNSGSSWAKKNGNYTISLAGNGTAMFAGSLGSGVVLSTNNGSSWTAVNTGLTNKIISALTMSGNNVFAGTHDGVFYSTNNGTSWNQVGLSNTWIESLYVYNGVLFAGTTNLGIYSQPLSQFCSITSFTPAEIIGATVTVNGTGFSTTASNNIVEFNGTLATVTNSTSTTLTVVVPSGATSGPITVTANGGQTAISATTFAVIPHIISFSPSLGIIGSTVTISGTGFSETSTSNTVQFNGTTTTVNNATQTSLTVTVPPTATSGPITVSVGGNTGTSTTSFSVVPTIASFTPLSGIIGSTVTISGTGFSTVALNNLAQINGLPAAVSNATPTSLTVIVPLRTKSGPISVSVGGQMATSQDSFTVTPPTITSFTPASGIIGSTVTIGGTNFSTTASIDTVRFNGTLTVVTNATSTALTVKVPIKTKTGPITVSVGGGQTISSANNFTVTPPTITSFTPASGIIGSTVIISGTNFSTTASIDTVRFNGVLAVVINATSTALTVKVPPNTTTGPITVSVGGGQVTSSSTVFCISLPKPTITLSSNTSGLILTSSSSSGNQWFLNDVVIANATDQAIPMNDAGSYSVQVTMGTCQSVASDPFVITGDLVFTSANEQHIVLYPNPASNFVYISLENLQTGLPVSLQVFDIFGHNLTEMTSQEDGINLDITSLASGYYVVRVSLRGNLYFGHFSKQ